jgi:hypothetical protein
VATSSKSSPADSVIDVEWREVGPADPRPATPVTVLRPEPVPPRAASRRPRAGGPALTRAPATVRGRCPCGREADLVALNVMGMEIRICPGCATLGHMGATLLARLMR